MAVVGTKTSTRFGIGIVAGTLLVGAATLSPAAAADEMCLGQPATIVGEGTIIGTEGPDVIVGSDGPDRIEGLGDDDIICGLGGEDLIIGGPGDDTLSGGGDADDIRGSSGIDVVDYSDATGPVRIALNLQADDGVAGEGDRVDPSVENAIGSLFGDLLIGNALPNEFWGLAGEDTIHGRGGNDTIWGGPDNDFLRAFAGDDFVHGGPGDDELRGAAGDDTLIGGPGDDALRGWAGTNDYCEGKAGFDTYFGCETILP